MDERKNKAADLARAEPLGPAFLRWSRWLPLVIVAAMSLLAWLVIAHEVRDDSLLEQRIQEENRLRMNSSEEHVSDYLEEVFSMLLFISQNDDVMAMRREARGFIQKIYEHGWENHQLTEVYVVERDFRGKRPPFMTFEHEPESLSAQQIHVASREQEEYRAQMEQMERFSNQPGLHALLSREILLCVPDAQGQQSPGFVYSVPIRTGDRLAGIVAGMIRTRTILEHLHQGLDRQVAFLANEKGVWSWTPTPTPTLHIGSSNVLRPRARPVFSPRRHRGWQWDVGSRSGHPPRSCRARSGGWFLCTTRMSVCSVRRLPER